MKRHALSIAVVAALVFAGSVLFWAGVAKAQQAPRAEGQAGAWAERMATSDVSGLWAQLCFEIKVSNEQLTKLRATFQSEWDKRKETAKGTTSMDELRTKLQEARKAFLEAVKKELTEEQQKAVAAWAEEAGRMGGGRPGGAGARPRGGR